MPNHGLCGRPIDLFESTLSQVWHLTAGKGLQRKDIVGLFNWDEKKPETVRVDLDNLNLPDGGSGTYVGFDYWADRFVPPFSGALEAKLRPASCQVISIQPFVERPVLVSTSRHVTQGIVDVDKQSWNSRKNEMRGRSKVVGEDPYELRIYAPTNSGPWQVQSADVSQADSQAGVTIESEQAGPEIRVTINSPENRPVSWKIVFKNE
jgi:hypothetical protein